MTIHPGPEPQLSIIDITVTHPKGFGGHEFELTDDDVFACTYCGGYEIALRRADGSIPECAGPKETP